MRICLLFPTSTMCVSTTRCVQLVIRIENVEDAVRISTLFHLIARVASLIAARLFGDETMSMMKCVMAVLHVLQCL